MKKTGKRACETLKGKFLLVGVVAAIFAVTVVLNLFLVSSVVAQEKKPKETAQEEKAPEEYEIETMTVTAQKREENVQDVPMSISVFSDIQLEDAGIENTIELTRFSPNVFIKQNTLENMVIIRGVSSFDASTFGPAGFYVDDISYSLPFMRNYFKRVCVQ